MSKPVINAILQGRWGNQLFTYAFARGYAERHGCELRTGPWLGQEIFQIDDPLIERNNLPLHTEFDVPEGAVDISLRTYAMSQKAIDWYTRSQVREWFTFRPKIAAALQGLEIPKICAHLRHGDFIGHSGFVAVSKQSYLDAAEQCGFIPDLCFVSEENPRKADDLPENISYFLPDFHVLRQATILLRANSSFSWWAATLAQNQVVLAPDLTGIPAGRTEPQYAPFVLGNWPAISRQHSFCTDLHLKP